MNFHDVRFPTSLSFGSVGGPARRTEIVTLSNGFEERNSPWSQSRRHFDAGVGMRSLDDLATLIAFFEARSGQLYGFRWKDWSDYKSSLPSENIDPTNQIIGIGDDNSVQFQLVKNYHSGDQFHKRAITKPVQNMVQLAISGDVQIAGVDFSVDYDTGIVEFTTAPSEGAQITAGFHFDVPVRFDTDRIESSMSAFSAGEIPSVPVVEVRV